MHQIQIFTTVTSTAETPQIPPPLRPVWTVYTFPPPAPLRSLAASLRANTARHFRPTKIAAAPPKAAITSGARDGLERVVSWSFGFRFPDEGQQGGWRRGAVSLRLGVSWCHCVGFSGSGVCLLNSSGSIIGIFGAQDLSLCLFVFWSSFMCVLLSFTSRCLVVLSAWLVRTPSGVACGVTSSVPPLQSYRLSLPNSYPSLVPTICECVERSVCLGMGFRGFFFVGYCVNKSFILSWSTKL